MKLIENNNITTFDIDSTLLLYKDIRVKTKNKVELMYGGEVIYLTVHKMHVMFLKHCKERGDFVILWSKNGWQWAQHVANVLELNDHVDLIMSKPTRHVDDKKDLSSIVGDGIWIEDIE